MKKVLLFAFCFFTFSFLTFKVLQTVTYKKVPEFKNRVFRVLANNPLAQFDPPSKNKVGTFQFVGTAFHLKDGFFVTNRHVCEGVSEISQISKEPKMVLQTNGAFPELHAVTAVRYPKDPDSDLCIVKTNHKLDYDLTLNFDMKLGDALYIFGFPNGSYGESLGVYDSHHFIWSHESLCGNAFILPGSSGSPVLNSNGELVAVAYALAGWGASCYVPVKNLEIFLKEVGLQ